MTYRPVSTSVMVSNEFLSLGKEENSDINSMKLQALLYYAYGWHLAIKDKLLFEENIYAYEWGPGVPSIYIKTKKYQQDPIQDLLTQEDYVKAYSAVDTQIRMEVWTPSGVEDTLKSFIRKIWDTHKEFTAVQLCNSTHESVEPWSIMKAYNKDFCNSSIPNSLIKEAFKQKIKRS